jgi:hypothetical protein
MAKFTDCPENERIVFLKDEFVRCIEELLIDPSEIKKVLPEDKFKTVMEFVPSLKVPECGCGTCLAMEKLDGRIPTELECIIGIARKRCEERQY